MNNSPTFEREREALGLAGDLVEAVEDSVLDDAVHLLGPDESTVFIHRHNESRGLRTV